MGCCLWKKDSGLAIRRALKPVLQQLQEAMMKYKWQPSRKLVVLHKNKSQFA